MKRQFMLCAAAVFAALVGTSAAAMAYPAYATTDLNVRSGPGTGYRVIGTLYDGARINVRFCQGSWCAINGPGLRGWASASYLATAQVRRPPLVVRPQIFLDFPRHHHRKWDDRHKPRRRH
ncbi:MAG: SH3 domain-containing protein [Proteobacteria bacterium]|nr:SH3 domain-containing protein [Pseudomonadota bacterium]